MRIHRKILGIIDNLYLYRCLYITKTEFKKRLKKLGTWSEYN